MIKKYAAPRMAEPKTLSVSSHPDGGLNLSDLPRNIGDSESPDVLNFWKHGGQLRLRPGLRSLFSHDFSQVVGVYPRDGRSVLLRKVVKDGETIEEKRGIYIVTRYAIFCYDGKNFERIADSLSWNDGWVSDYGDYSFNRCVILPSGGAGGSRYSDSGANWSVTGDPVYIIGSGRFLLISPQVIVYEKPTGVPHFTAALLASNVSPHIPVLYTDCRPDGTGTKAEVCNIISEKRVQKFTTDASSYTYHLCENNLDNSPVTAVYDTGGVSLYTFGFDPDVSTAAQNGIIASLDRAAGTIFFTAPLADAKGRSIKDNLVVTYGKTVCEKNPVKNCSVGRWYGGGTQAAADTPAAGYYSRMFLTGYENTPNRIYYSAANDPTYFAEDAYIDVGAPADPVTALDIQFDILAVFKKSSIYSIGYSDNADSATFTIKEVNATVGCDMPETLALLSNVLVWGSSVGGGGIYALQSTSVKDERAVKLLSKKIGLKLLSVSAEDLQSASAVCDGTSYFLLAKDSAFILDYENLRLSGGQLQDSAQWFVWSLPRKLSGVFLSGSRFAASAADDGSIFIFDDDAPDDCGRFFDAYWYSKSFDFGEPATLKRFYKFILTIGCGGAAKLEVCFCDSGGERRKTVTIGEHPSMENKLSLEQTLSFMPASYRSKCAYIGVRRVDGALAPLGIFDFTLFAAPSADNCNIST